MKNHVLRSDKYGIMEISELPAGWDDLKNAPDNRVKFLKEPAAYLEKAYEAEWIEAEVYLDTFIDGVKDSKRIDFTKYVYHYANKMVSVGLKPSV